MDFLLDLKLPDRCGSSIYSIFTLLFDLPTISFLDTNFCFIGTFLDCCKQHLCQRSSSAKIWTFEHMLCSKLQSPNLNFSGKTGVRSIFNLSVCLKHLCKTYDFCNVLNCTIIFLDLSFSDHFFNNCLFFDHDQKLFPSWIQIPQN